MPEEEIKVVKDKRKINNKTKKSYAVDPTKNHLRAKGGFGDNPQNRNNSGKGGFRDNPQNINKKQWWETKRSATKKIMSLPIKVRDYIFFYWGFEEQPPYLTDDEKDFVEYAMADIFEHPNSPKSPNGICESVYLDIKDSKSNFKVRQWVTESLEGKAIQRQETKITDNNNKEELEEWKTKYLELERSVKRMMIATPVNEQEQLGDE